MKVIHISIIKNIETTTKINTVLKINNLNENILNFPNEIRRKLIKETMSF